MGGERGKTMLGLLVKGVFEKLIQCILDVIGDIAEIDLSSSVSDECQ